MPGENRLWAAEIINHVEPVLTHPIVDWNDL